MEIIDLTAQFSLSAYASDAHAGTHIDAPAYVLQGQKTISQLGLDVFLVDGVVLDLTHSGRGQAIDDEDLEAAEEAAGLALREGEAVLLHTSAAEVPERDPSTKHAYLSVNGAEYLEFKRVGIVGIDTPSVDSPDDLDLPAHRALLSKEILVLEGLTNLEKVDLPRFRLASFPLRINAATSPVRAVAIVDE